VEQIMTINISSLGSQIASAVFSKIDTKNQGYIDKSELNAAFGSISSDNDESDNLFSALDTDGDGKITKSEMTQGMENLLSQLNSSSTQMQSNDFRSPPPDGNRPPPPPDGEQDAGLSKDQMVEMASSTNDTKLASLLNDVANNFDAADTNKDGKVTRQEAMAYEKSKGTESTNSTSTSNTDSDAVMKKIAQLLITYGFDSSSQTSTVSASA
jgi:Ca2+-binding EF-hand superfamily protein